MLRVLGEVAVDGHGVVRSQAQRVLLAALALDRGSVVSVERLAHLVWGDNQPENPASSLQNHVSRMRKALGDACAVTSEGGGYCLGAGADDLDLAAFETGFTEACAAPLEARLEAVERTIVLWRGSPFTELDDDRALAETAHLQEVHRALQEMRAESRVAVGRTHEAIAELEALRSTDPLRERTVELLMRAYVDAGRKTDALHLFQSLRAAMVDALGLEPGPALRELETAILTEAIVAAPRTQHETAPARHTPTMGPPASTFLGRNQELAQLESDLQDHRMVTLVGPGGVGKTRLAMHTAAATSGSFDAGVATLELASLRNPLELPEVVASELDLQPRSGLAAVERIAGAIEKRSLLLVLDNCEHVIDTAAAFIEQLVRATPNLRVLATSREPLNIDGERVIRLRPLDIGGAAVELFADRAAACSEFQLDNTNRALVERICGSLDGLPLALELAAARCSTMTLQEILEGLDDAYSLFNRGRRTAPPRHQSLRALVEWSVTALTDRVKATFAELSVFAGTFTIADAAAITGRSQPEAADLLAELIERSLLVEHRNPTERTRYGFLETIRAYAAELFASTGRPDMVVERHSAWLLEEVEAMRAQVVGIQDRDHDAAVIAGLADVRVVQRRFLEADDSDRGLRLAASLHHLAFFRMQSEVFTWITACADAFGNADHPDAETVLASASIGSWQSGDLAAAEHYAERASEVADRSSWPCAGRGAAEANGDVLQFHGEDLQALACFEEALSISRECGDPVRVVTNLVDLAINAGYVGEIDRARAAIAEARRLTEPGASTAMAAWLAYGEGEALAEVDPVRALEALDEAVDHAEQASALFITGVAGLTRSGLQVRSGEPSEAIVGMIDLLEHWRRAGARLQQWITLRTVVELLVRLGHHRDAALIAGAVESSGSISEIGPADAARLEVAKQTIVDQCRQAPELFVDGAGLGQADVVDVSIASLRTLLARVDGPPSRS